MLVIFAAAIVFFIGLMAVVIDVTWYWTNSLKVQRAADAAALAGAVWLPDEPNKARTVAFAAAKQNGYTTGSGVTVTAVQNPTRDVQLDTSVSAPVPTFFMRLFGITSIQATRTAKAEYVLPVPMGSPLNYFGAFGTLRGGWIQTDTGWNYPTAHASQRRSRHLDHAAVCVPRREPRLPPSSRRPATSTDVQGFTNFRPERNPRSQGLRHDRDERTVPVRAAASKSSCRRRPRTRRASASSRSEVSSNADLGASATWYGITAPNRANGNPATLTTTPTEYEFGGDASTERG